MVHARGWGQHCTQMTWHAWQAWMWQIKPYLNCHATVHRAAAAAAAPRACGQLAPCRANAGPTPSAQEQHMSVVCGKGIGAGGGVDKPDNTCAVVSAGA